MLAWTGYVRDAETKATLFGHGYPSVYSGTAGALAGWVRTLESWQFYSTLLRTPVDEEHPGGYRSVEPAEARDRVLAKIEALDPERRIMLDLWDQS